MAETTATMPAAASDPWQHLYGCNRLVNQLSYIQLNARAHGRGQGNALKVCTLNCAWFRFHDYINKRLEVVR